MIRYTKIHVTILMFMVLLMTSCKYEDENQKIRESLKVEITNYPQAGLVDVYKNFFQDAFGPGHMIPDTQSAVNYLNYELENAIHFDSLLIQPLGASQSYYRVNLLLVKNGLLSKEELINAFISSANKAEHPGIEVWNKQWHKVLNIINKMDLNFEDFINDSIFIDSLLSSGNFVVHHSKKYKSLYHPHYRIVHRNDLPDNIKYLVNE